jgi:hypothetical protein
MVMLNLITFDHFRTRNLNTNRSALSLSQVVISFRGTEPSKAKDIYSDANIFQVRGTSLCASRMLRFIESR